MKKHRHNSGTQGQQKTKVYLCAALGRIEADYYAQRSQEPIKRISSRAEKQQNRRNGARTRSDLDAKTVANIRFLKEELGFSVLEIANKYSLGKERVRQLCYYASWAEVMPSNEGLTL